MLVTIDKRGSISLLASVRKDLGFCPGTHLELTVEAGGAIMLFPVEIYRTIDFQKNNFAAFIGQGWPLAYPLPAAL